MKERPILFSDEMVRAILDGRKTMTRRLVKPQPIYPIVGCEGGIGFYERYPNPSSSGYPVFGCPYGNPGDLLWVRETWCQKVDPLTSKPIDGEAWYCADGHEVILDDGDGFTKWNKDGSAASPWKPSIHMPRWASRLTLEVVSVRVERLQEISEEDASAEGCYTDSQWSDLAGVGAVWPSCPNCNGWGLHQSVGPNLGVTEVDCVTCDTPKKRFRLLWDSINAKRGYGWDANPWVWVVEFKKLEAAK